MIEDRIRTSDRTKGNVYERIVAAAREARRLNAVRLRGGMMDTDTKVTNEALRRTADGEVEWEFARREMDGIPAGPPPAEESAPPSETPPEASSEETPIDEDPK